MIYAEVEEYEIDGKKQDLPGFNDKYINFVDYILKITDEIWEERAIWVIYETYTDDVVIHIGARSLHGVQGVVLGTVNTLSSFPDRKMGGEAVIWSKVDGNRFYSSHRIGSTATNLGATQYGEATGKKVFFRTIADCFVSENRIFEEWLVRDNLHLVQQLDFDPVEMAKRDQRYQGKKINLPINGIDIVPNGKPLDLSNSNDLIISMFYNVWKAKNFDNLSIYYHKLATIHAICERDIIGPRVLKTYLEYIIASFPTAKITLERVSSNKKGDAYEVAARWKITGLHEGEGFFGEPSGKLVVMPVICHYMVKNGKITEEWMVFDGFDTLCQIYADVVPTFSQNGQAKELTKDIHLEHKQKILSFFKETNSTASHKISTILKKYLARNITLNITKPYEAISGINEYATSFWQPLLQSFPDLENQPYILIGGEYEGKNYVSCTGNFIGTFKEAWHGIPPTGQPTWLRYTGLFQFEKGKIAKAWYFFDMLDVMRQAGFHFFPNRGQEIIPPAPMTGDGILNYSTDPKEGQKTLNLINAMLNGLGEYDGKTLESMDQTRFWDEKNMMWYGPSGIGTTRGLKGFEDYHQLPFLITFPNRGMLEKTGDNQFCQLGDGDYAFDFGFPLMYATHQAGDWLGLEPTGKKITMRVLDFWRREGDKLVENWVMIDMIDILEQLGINVFEMLKKRVSHTE